MTRLIKSDSIKEGEFLNRWFKIRVINKNQNVILAFTGSTGSGKTYNSLSCSEEWYTYIFNEKFNVDNVCFSLGELAKRIDYLHKNKLLRRGDIFILEEAGANYGNLDFQNKLSKMFSYILQSFRSMNLILILTLPVLTMVNKTARQLIHGHFITSGIDYNEKIGKVKPFFHQLNQSTGKSYWKYPRLRLKGRVITLHRLKFRLPSDDLIKSYELKKSEYVYNLTSEFIKESDKIDNNKLLESKPIPLTKIELDIYECLKNGMSNKDISIQKQLTTQRVGQIVQNIFHKGYDLKFNSENPKNEIIEIPNTHTP